MTEPRDFELLREMLRIRRIEESIAERYPQGEMRCPVHLSIGQEACPVGVVAALEPRDEMVSTHRCHAHYLAKGGSLRAMLGELYGKASGCARGNGGSMHLIDRGVGFLGATSIVGGTIPVGVGAAFANRYRGDRRIVVVCIGDAAVEEGVFHESANFASLHRLAVLFLCENNRYSCFTRLEDRQPARPLSEIARAHGLRCVEGDGNDVFAVRELISNEVAELREGRGPVFALFETYRRLEHCGPFDDDHLGYRPREEIDAWGRRDPLAEARSALQQRGDWNAELEQEMERQIAGEISEAFEHAISAEPPAASELGSYVYAG